MFHYQQHIFMCVNQKEDKEKKCCAQGNAEALCAYLKKRVVELELKAQGIRVSHSGCMGRCSEGPALVIYPQGIWYTYHSEADIESILQEHILKEKVITELLI